MDEPFIYDKAKYHYEGEFPTELDATQAYIHIGMFLGWLCDRRLLSAQMVKDFGDDIRQFSERKITGPTLLRLAGGALVSDMLNAQGNAFAVSYFVYQKGQYIEDYADLLSRGLQSLYHVKDTWQNYNSLQKRIDERYQEWLGVK